MTGKYIQITQDGAGRITAETPNEIAGIYSDEITCCTVIIMVADNAVTLIHATGNTSQAAVLREYNLLNGCKSLAVIFNPSEEQPTKQNAERLINGLPVNHPTPIFYGCYSGRVMVDRSGKITPNFSPSSSNDLLPPKELDRRYIVNMLTNLFLSCRLQQGTMLLDVQYDGTNQPEPPALPDTLDAIYQTFSSMFRAPNNRESYIRYLRCFSYLVHYVLFYEPSLYASFIQTKINNDYERDFHTQARRELAQRIHHMYKTQDIALTFRKAAKYGHVEHLALILGTFPEVINSAGAASKRTALHNGVIDGKRDNVNFLLALGADPALKDADGKTAQDYDEKEIITSATAKSNSEPSSQVQTLRNELIKNLPYLYKTTNIEVAFRRAARHGSVVHLALILSKKPEVINSVGTETGKSALHNAVLGKKGGGVKFLLAHGADVLLRDKAGKTAQDYDQDELLMDTTATPTAQCSTNIG